jgi:hypothetical protein
MKTTPKKRNALIGFSLALPLAACGGGGGSDKAPTPPVVVTTAQEDKFGLAFGADFRASPNSEPATVKDGDIVPVSFMTEPIDIQ